MQSKQQLTDHLVDFHSVMGSLHNDSNAFTIPSPIKTYFENLTYIAMPYDYFFSERNIPWYPKTGRGSTTSWRSPDGTIHPSLGSYFLGDSDSEDEPELSWTSLFPNIKKVDLATSYHRDDIKIQSKLNGVQRSLVKAKEHREVEMVEKWVRDGLTYDAANKRLSEQSWREKVEKAYPVVELKVVEVGEVFPEGDER